MVAYSTIRDELIKEMGESTSDTDVQAQFLAWMQEGLDRMVSALGNSADFMYLTEEINTVNGTTLYSLQTEAAEAIAIKYKTEAYHLVMVPQYELLNRGYILTTTGKPVYWYNDIYDATNNKHKIGFYPVPNSAYVLTVGERRQTKIYVASDTCFLPQKYIPALRSYVRMRFNLKDGSPQKAGFERAEWKDILSDASKARPRGRRLKLGETGWRSENLDSTFIDFWEI